MFKFKLCGRSMTARAGIIREAGDDITTPIRVLNSREMEHGLSLEKSGLVKLNFPHQIGEVTQYIKSDSIYNMIKNAEASIGLKNQIVEKSKRFNNRITIFHPSLEKNLEINDRINEVMIDIQTQSDIDAISILDKYNSSEKEFEKRLQRSIKQIEESDSIAEPMPVIRLDTDWRKFGGKLKICVNNNINIINLVYAPIKENYVNYSHLINNMCDEDIWLHLSEVGNKIFNKCSLIHTMPLFSIDSFALKSRPLPLGKFKKIKSIPKRFDSNTLGEIDINEHKQMYKNKLNCDCFVDNFMGKKRNLNNFLKVFNGAQLLRQAIACHNTCSSFNEFIYSRDKILENDYRTYLKRKKYIYQPVKKFFKIDLKDSLLKKHY